MPHPVCRISQKTKAMRNELTKSNFKTLTDVFTGIEFLVSVARSVVIYAIQRNSKNKHNHNELY